ncbi:hypothetical protein AB0J83_09000 [Actinoplanes sp. NPDC049596]|uniref:hypothetical protein n=1 Tax=unclassified Actinoplanes TaxID=2626549 RepID=UPI00341EA13E
MSEPEQIHPRQTLADFELAAKLGESAAAEVFRARNRTFDIVVALKLWRRPFSLAVQQAVAEACRLQYELSDHPNVARLYWADPTADPPWTAAELHQHSLAAGPIASAPRIATDVLRALTAIHRRQRPHGALHPGNVLVSDGRAVLGDLASAATRGDATSQPLDLQAAVTLIGELFEDPPPAVRVVLANPPRTAEELLAALENAQSQGRTGAAENAGPFRPGIPQQNTGAYDSPRPAEAAELPANLYTPAPASRRENARSYPEKPPTPGSASRPASSQSTAVQPFQRLDQSRPWARRLRIAAITAAAIVLAAAVAAVIAYVRPVKHQPDPGGSPPPSLTRS